MVLVTGVSGFIGKKLLLALVDQYGADNVLALTSAPVSECNYLLHNGYDFEPDYIVRSGFQSVKTVIHAGAFTPKTSSDTNQIQGCNSNIVNTSRLLNLKLPYLKKFIFLSSLDVYGYDERITESTVIAPVSLYGQSKLYCEKMIEAFGSINNLSIQILRVGHIYGPGEEVYQKLIPSVIRKLLLGQPLQIMGSGEEKRSFLFIDDLVMAILKSVEIRQNVGIINLVGGRSIKVKELIAMLVKISGGSVNIEHISSSINSRNLVFDNSKMKRELVNEKTDLEEGLRLEWNHMKGLLDENLL